MIRSVPLYLSVATLALVSGLAVFAAPDSEAAASDSATSNSKGWVEITLTDTQRCFATNGLPDHPTGTFPNRGNPNAIEAQEVRVCTPLQPEKAMTITPIRGTMGIAINGVVFRPNTAGFYDADAPRGHSPDGDRKWSLDIHGAPGKLGLDFNNAHVGPGGLYHYHGIANSLVETSGSSLIGFAGDGYSIHYIGEDAQAGYDLRSGTRTDSFGALTPGPGGTYDGTYNEDYVYVGGEGRLDPCNGGQLDGQYVYFVTDSYPFVPRCLTGKVSPDFNTANHREERGERRRRDTDRAERFRARRGGTGRPRGN
ncbi:hypothetical protein GCM10007853_00580 [Algimonas ampicilliniresistens]|uniref:YHYH domain-containing protein n=1 Tax=Algimonas ampicilliniresistens TaxID=1298735 RepID=A0ABQ5V630_9PROT|nr:YHYH protein [Algimonas ampicilliniresistens]GLQ22184.1 hypothetical protein GCM10007853_00580 [Algimonas ampicilliniresistens]